MPAQYSAVESILTEAIQGLTTDEEARQHNSHNHFLWRCVQGGLQLASPLDFEPLSEYWYLTERRLLVAFFSQRFRELYVPATAMRRLAIRVFRHFQRAREDGRFGEPMLATAQANIWPEIVERIVPVATELTEMEEYLSGRRDAASIVGHQSISGPAPCQTKGQGAFRRASAGETGSGGNRADACAASVPEQHGE